MLSDIFDKIPTKTHPSDDPFVKYLYEIQSSKGGIGILAGNLFYTAAHILDDYSSIKIGRKKVILSSDNTVYISPQTSQYIKGFGDLAIFDVSSVSAPIEVYNILYFNNPKTSQ